MKKRLKVPAVILIVLLSAAVLYSLAWFAFYFFVCKPHLTDESVRMSDEGEPPGYAYIHYEAPMDENYNHFYLTFPKFGHWTLSFAAVSSYTVDTSGEAYELPDGSLTYPEKTMSGTPYNIGFDAYCNIFGKIKRIVFRITPSGADDAVIYSFLVDENMNLLNEDELPEEAVAMFQDAKQYLHYYFDTAKNTFRFD